MKHNLCKVFYSAEVDKRIRNNGNFFWKAVVFFKTFLKNSLIENAVRKGAAKELTKLTSKKEG